MPDTPAPEKIVLAYSGGLDTSVIGAWLMETYGCELITYTADLGQGEDLEAARAKAERLGASACIVEDLSEPFAADYVFPMLRGNACYEGEYLLGTSIARPLIGRRLVETAREHGADAIAHGATGKGNDQVRFELAIAALAPELSVIAPWRTWDLRSRSDLMDWCAARQIHVPAAPPGQASPYSTDANLLHISYEGGDLEDPWHTPDESMWQWTCAPERAPEAGVEVVIGYSAGDAVSLDGEALSPAELMRRLNALAGAHGIGRADIVENRYVGIKSRGCYETPAGTVLHRAHRALESIVLDREAAHLKDELMPRYAELIYNGYWFAPEREALQALIDSTQERVTGEVRLRLYKGSVQVLGRRSPRSLYSPEIATFEDDAGSYDQADAEGFITLNALRLKYWHKR
ncbi:MAG: argininosuccinate synthase [Gammaproteobacteria bacterium AqS3]|nr:argininosuccinate synthase [Gammaproteobacteria bacterium AqS3]